MHDVHAPVRILRYYVQYGSPRGGVGTTLTGLCHFTPRAESHAGFCHGGAMCALLDDVMGWCAFLVTGTCRPWTGYTVQINTSLQKPIAVQAILLVQARIVKVERRKVFVEAELVDPGMNGKEDVYHAKGDGLVILNKGVLPAET